MAQTTSAPNQHLDATELTTQARPVLLRVLRVAFPHPQFPDGPYERTAEKILVEAAASPWWRVTLTQGLNALNDISGGDFTALTTEESLSILRRVEATAFFGFVRRTAVLNLYDDEESWAALGYEGPSFDQGGYLHRGFDDLDWLPDPRVEEYDGPEPFVAYRPGRFGPTVPVITEQHADTSNQPGRREAEMGEVTK